MSQYKHPLTGSNIGNLDLQLSPRFRKPLTDFTIILDLDATLIKTIDHEEANELSMRGPEGIRTYMGIDNSYSFDMFDEDGKHRIYGVIRPHCREFLDFCNTYFKNVIVYTAGTYEYGHGITSQIFSQTSDRYHPDYILTRSECLYLDRRDCPIRGLRKPLALVIPEYDETKSVLIDDRISNIRFNPRNGIIIPPYNPTTRSEALSDQCLRTLMNWFNQPKILQLEDIRDAEKMSIFEHDGDLDADHF